MRAKAVAIPRDLKRRHSRKWPHTGDILGRPAAVEAKISIVGSEYDGFPAPLRQVVVYLPKGTKIHAHAFKTCPVSRFANQEPERCPKRSLASPPGEARGTVRFGDNEPVHERVLVQGYFAPRGGLTFWIEGRTPVQLEQFATGRIQHMKGRFGQRLTTQVPLISTVPGAPFASTEYIDVTVGAAYKRHGRLISYGTMPHRCAKGGFPVKAKLSFGAGPRSTWETVTVKSRVPCPHRGGRRRHRIDHHRGHSARRRHGPHRLGRR